MFDRLTKGVDEREEIKKGNAAVGIMLAAVIFSIANVVRSGVSQITASLSGDMESIIVGPLLGLLNLAIGLIFAVVAIYSP